MSKLIPQDTPVHPPEHPEDHEQSDVPIRALALTLAALTAVLLLTFGLVWLMFRAYERHQASLDVKLTNVEQKADVPIDRPRLQGVQGFHDTTAAQDTAVMMDKVKTQLETEGPLSDGKYHIHIDRAMQMVVDSGQLKAATQPATTQPPQGASDAK